MATTCQDRERRTQSRTSTELAKVFILGCILCWAGWQACEPEYDPQNQDCPGGTKLASKINLNTDPWWKLAALPNIGMVKAKRIVQYRESSGGQPVFTNVNDLAPVPGIGPKTIANLRDQVSCDLQRPPLTTGPISPAK